MKTHISYHDIHERRPIERELGRQADKLKRRLKKFHPDLLNLHVSLARRTRPVIRFISSVTLHFPSGPLNASEEGPAPVIALKHACAELLRELAKHQAKLRGEHQRRRVPRRRTALRP